MISLSRVAARNVTRNRNRTLLTLAAIIIGVMSAILIDGICNGVVQVLYDMAVNGSYGAIQIYRAGYWDSIDALPIDMALPYDAALLERIRHVPGVKAVTGRIQFGGTASNGTSQCPFSARAIDVKGEGDVCPLYGLNVDPSAGTLVPSDSASVLPLRDFAASFGVVAAGARPGSAGEGAPRSTLTLASVSAKGRANSLDVTVKGYWTGAVGWESKRFLVVPLALAQDLLNMHGEVTELLASVDDLARVEQIRDGVQAELGPQFEVFTFEKTRPWIPDVILRIRFVEWVCAFILFVTVLTVVVNTTSMNAFERAAEIGTMLALGVTRRQVVRLFAWEAALVGVLGAGVGAVASSSFLSALSRHGISLKMAATSSVILRPHVGLLFVALVTGVVMVGELLAALYPAIRISKLRPIDALRGG